MKAYYNQKNISSGFFNFFKKFNLSLPHAKSISSIITAMISAESVVSSDISKNFKDNFSYILLESNQRRIWRFFYSFSFIAYYFFELFISYIISNFKVKHFDNTVHISFDHMFVRNKFTILLFSLRIGKQGIPIWFRCFKTNDSSSSAFSTSLIKQGISFCASLFPADKFHVIFLADRWFPNVDIFEHIQSLNCFFCIRSKSYFYIHFYNSRGFLVKKHLRDISPLSHSSRVLKDVFFSRKMFKTNIVISRGISTDDVWYIVTNDNTSRAIRNYSYRFGSIECIFKNQKTNGFRLESTNTHKLEHFISLFTIVCTAICWLVIIGSDYVKNKSHYKIKIRDTRKSKSNSTSRLYSYFSIGLTLFNLCYYNYVDFTLKFNFILYDV